MAVEDTARPLQREGGGGEFPRQCRGGHPGHVGQQGWGGRGVQAVSRGTPRPASPSERLTPARIRGGVQKCQCRHSGTPRGDSTGRGHPPAP